MTTDRYPRFTGTPADRFLPRRPGLPQPVALRRRPAGQPLPLPVDVAETAGWPAQPGSGAVNGQVVRVCGQSLLGA